jgi:hypothetical protein
MMANGLATYEQIISRRGGDWREVMRQRRVETAEQARSDVMRVVAIADAVDGVKADHPDMNLHWEQIAAIVGAATAPGAYLSGSAKMSEAETKADVAESAPAEMEVRP